MNSFAACDIKIQRPSLGVFQRLSSLLHVLAAIVLFLFAISHFAFLTVIDINHKAENPVFPFLSNESTYALAGVFELSAALLCFRWRGNIFGSAIILTFVGIILWYRWAFFYTGGYHCNCVGYLGTLLHLSKAQEVIIPKIALVFLTVTALPCLCRFFFRIIKRRFRWLGILGLLSMLTMQTSAEQTIQIQGTIDVGLWNPKDNSNYTNTHSSAAFTAIISEHAWIISATNLVDKAYWAKLAYDGTNTYTTEPNGQNLWFQKRPNGDAVLTSISPGPFYFPRDGDWLGLSVIWMTYCLTPEIVAQATTNGVTIIPAPWWAPRLSAKGYGYKWVVHFANGRFINDLNVVRDTRLDLSTNQEILRWTFDYPDTVAERNAFKQDLSIRMLIPSGYTDANYKCTEWYHTNGISIPIASEFYRWWFDFQQHQTFKFPYCKGFLNAKTVTVLQNSEPHLELPDQLTYVRDYRFKRMNESRVFNYVSYQLKAGDAWRADDDSNLLAQAEYGLKHGIKINSLDSPKNILAWIMLALIFTPIIIGLCYAVKQKSKNRQR